jgi:hypothetical protein
MCATIYILFDRHYARGMPIDDRGRVCFENYGTPGGVRSRLLLRRLGGGVVVCMKNEDAKDGGMMNERMKMERMERMLHV